MALVEIFDTTLRDGEQAPGFSMNVTGKLRMARQLERLGVDVIEAGFPIASEGDRKAVRAIAEEIKSATVAALARTCKPDIDCALQALKHACRPRLHVFIATSDLHLRYKLRKSRQQVLAAAVEAVRYARGYCEEVEFSAEDASRTDRQYLCDVFAAVVEAGATILNIPDTVGYSTPGEFASLFRFVREHLPDLDSVKLSAHCHNDLGLAVANSLAAIQTGARQVECTINGVGERAGNAALEEIVMALRVRQNLFGVETNIRTKNIYATSQLLSEITGVAVQPNKAITGQNAFAHEAGIHQDGIIKSPLTYEIMTPESVGVAARSLVFGKHSGRHGLEVRLRELGLQLSSEELEECYQAAIRLADRKKYLSNRDLLATFQEVVRRSNRNSASESRAEVSPWE